MSSTAVEFGLINTLRTHNVIIDTMLCMLVPLLIQKIVAYVQQSPQSLLVTLRDFLIPPKDERRVSRVIEVKQRFNRWGKVWDYEQKNHLLQKAISIYLADVLDLKSKNAQYELLEKTKKSNKITKTMLDATVSESDCSTTCSESLSSDDDDEYYGEVNRLNVEALPPLNEWIQIESGVFFKHETVAPENTGEKKITVKESTVNFRFESSLPDASKRIDAIIDRAFKNYQAIERRKHVEDKSRYFYVQADTAAANTGDDQNNNATPAVAYKRYALGEEKTFENLFFEEKEQLLQLLANFQNRAGKFAIKGFPYKLGLLLHGPPGTGKTSLIKAIAQHTKRHVVTISLGKIKTNQHLLDALFDMKFAVQGLDSPIEMDFEDVVFVMEDIDCASSIVKARAAAETKDVEVATTDKSAPSEDNKLVSSMIKACLEDEKKYNMRNDELNLSGLLNVLDGVIDCPGRIVIMTTNHPEKLDSALVRPGRVNKKLLLSYMGCTHIQQMIEYYCVAKLDEDQVRRLSESFEISSQTFTPAEIEELCAEHDDVDAVLGGFERLAAQH
ncbi:ATPase family associated domain-containing protein [Phytophthora infestans]|uniref:ATPase family associated domain-containing protein n=1 Tax=Phytophthora infestans TaxID=4787 RepID=A0A833W6I8_PHYIN|nr:ATPase family associated domain-containing protein [Phytophthora infestans]